MPPSDAQRMLDQIADAETALLWALGRMCQEPEISADVAALLLDARLAIAQIRVPR